MKFLLGFLVVAYLACALCEEDEIDQVLKNESLLQSFIDCFLEKGNCSAIGEELRDHVKGILENGCEKCDDGHKEAIKKVLVYLVKNKKDTWDELVSKYDPDGKFKEKYADFLTDIQ